MAPLLTLALLAATLFLPDVEARSRRTPRATPRSEQDGSTILVPVPPAGIASTDGRGSAHGTQGDYINKGLSTTMDMVDRGYGLRDSETFYWGLDGKPIAGITAYATGKAVRVLSLERFEGVLETAQCTPTEVKLTFTQEVQFDEVQTSWQWVNDAEENYIVLVTESAWCNVDDGDATLRQPWHISHAGFDDNTNVVTLTATPKSWQTAFESWHLDLDTRGLPQAPQQKLKARQAWKKDTTLPLTHDLSTLNTTFEGNGGPTQGSGSVNCVRCSTAGSLDLVFSLDVPTPAWADLKAAESALASATSQVADVATSVASDVASAATSAASKVASGANSAASQASSAVSSVFSEATAAIGGIGSGLFPRQSAQQGEDVFNGTMTVIPRDVKAHIELQTTTTAGLKYSKISPVVSFPIGPINILGIISIGPEVSIGIASSISTTGKLDVTTGVDLAIPNDSRAVVQVGTGADSILENWEPAMTPIPPQWTSTASVASSIALEWKINYHVEIAGPSRFYSGAELGLVLGAPRLTMNTTVFEASEADEYDCDSSDVGNNDYGASLYIAAGADLGLYGAAGYSMRARPQSIATTLTLMSTATTLFSTCTGVVDAAATGIPPPPEPLVPNQDLDLGGNKGAPVNTAFNGAPNATTSTQVSWPTGGYDFGQDPCPAGVAEGQLVCRAGNDRQFGLCNHSIVVWQPVAPGTGCYNGRIMGTGVYAVPATTAAPQQTPPPQSADAGTCEAAQHGLLICKPDDATKFGLCNFGSLVWQQVASGTNCVAGKIVGVGIYAAS